MSCRGQVSFSCTLAAALARGCVYERSAQCIVTRLTDLHVLVALSTTNVALFTDVEDRVRAIAGRAL